MAKGIGKFMVALSRLLGVGWRRAGDASVLQWLFPTTFTKVAAVLIGFAGFIGGAVGHAPPWSWIPLWLFCSVLGLAAAHLLRTFRKTPQTKIEQSKSEPVPEQKPPTLLEIFNSDFDGAGNIFEETSLQFGPDGPKSKFHTRLFQDFNAGSKFLAFYVPRSDLAHETYVALAYQAVPIMNRMESNIQISAGMMGQHIVTTSADLAFTGFVYLYCEDGPQLHEHSDLTRLYEAQGLKLRVRASDYHTMKIMSWHHEHGT